jgi:L-asparagine transporter-like permease
MLEEREATPEQGLRHQLSAGQMALVAVGGSIGTGLLLGSAAALKIAGPGVILSYALAAFIAWTVALALGELSSQHPAAGSFGVYGDIYLSEWAGFIARAGYWGAIAVSIGAELVASATYMAYWLPSVPAVLWVGVFSAALLLVNLCSVGAYGRFEFWFAMIKVVTIGAFVVIGAGLLLSGRAPAHYTADGGFLPQGPFSPLFAISFAIYTFAGVEMVAVTSGESRVAGDIPRAVRLTFIILACVYLGAISVLAGVMPWNRAGVSESPFVSVFRQANIPGATHVMNFVVLTAALSGSNAALYIASRTLFSLSRNRWAPKIFGRLNRAGSPVPAVLASSYGIVVAMVLETWWPKTAFVSILGAVLVGMLLSWLVSLAAHVNFRQQLSAEQVASLPMRSPLGAWGSALGFVLVIAAIVETGWISHLTIISGAVYLALLTLAYSFIRTRRTRFPQNPRESTDQGCEP